MVLSFKLSEKFNLIPNYGAIKYIIMSPPKKVFSFNIGEEAIKELELIAKLYLNDKLEKDYKMDKMF